MKKFLMSFLAVAVLASFSFAGVFNNAVKPAAKKSARGAEFVGKKSFHAADKAGHAIFHVAKKVLF